MTNAHALASARALIASLDIDEAARFGATNFHARGLHYVNLFRSDRYTAKLYFAVPGELEHNAEGNVVNPHTHGYAFRQTVLRGAVDNVVLASCPATAATKGRALWRFADYYSPFKTGGVARLDWHDLPVAMEETVTTYGPGEGYFMDTQSIHTIRHRADAGVLILFSEQYADEGRPSTTYFSREGVEPTFDGLYGRMTVDRARALLSLVPVS